MVTCEVANVRITDEHGGVANFIVPAYTRDSTDLSNVVCDYLNEYIDCSDGGPISVADFAFFLLTKAHSEPRQQ